MSSSHTGNMSLDVPAIDWWRVLADPTAPINYPCGSDSDTHSSRTGQILPTIGNTSSTPQYQNAASFQQAHTSITTSQSTLSFPVGGDGRRRDIPSVKCTASHAPAARGPLARSLQQPPPHTGPLIKARPLAALPADKGKGTTMGVDTGGAAGAAGTPVVRTLPHETVPSPTHPHTYILAYSHCKNAAKKLSL